MRRAAWALAAVVWLGGMATVPLAARAQDEEVAAAEPPAQLVVLNARVDRIGGTITVSGLDFGDQPPRVTLGVIDLPVVSHDAGYAEAVLPEELPAGTYLLIVARGPAVTEYDLFHVAIPEAPADEAPEPPPARPSVAVPAPGPRGAPGPPGPPGPAGAPGAPGPSARAELAGQRCPAGSFLAGFDTTGALACEPLPAPETAPRPAPVALPAAAPPVAATLPCADAVAGGVDLDDAWGPRRPIVAAYPAVTAGELRGSVGSPVDRDLFAIDALEADGALCLSDRNDRPLRATLELRTTAEQAALCACWSADGAPCSRSVNRCVSAAAGAPAQLELPMRMVCGTADAGLLEVEVRGGNGATGGCAEWVLAWALSE